MFRQFKSAVIWFYLIKFRRKLSLIALLIFLILFSNSIYGDVINYLKITQQLSLLKYVLIAKWVLILFSLWGIAYLALSLFRQNKKSSKTAKKSPVSTLSSTEQALRNKPKLQSKADQLIARKAEELAKKRKQE